MFPGSKNRACDRESRADHGKRIWRVHTHRALKDIREGIGNSGVGVMCVSKVPQKSTSPSMC